MVDRLNPTIRAAGWTVELLGWEDRLPGFGRPQAQINDDVDACDLFLGVLWRRWGSSTGEFESGFEEEFERAIGRQRRSKSPEIWIYFKRVEDPSDPGEQLRQVLAFYAGVKRSSLARHTEAREPPPRQDQPRVEVASTSFETSAWRRGSVSVIQGITSRALSRPYNLSLRRR